jgi:NADPH:quinone reductase-like Zn-dependent oxidoreductase
MVRAVAATAWGRADAIDAVAVDSRPPGRGEVVVAVHATAISPFDLKRTAGMMGRDDRLSPLRPGDEASGVVTSAGDYAGIPVSADARSAA